jgi:hypothetical protein
MHIIYMHSTSAPRLGDQGLEIEMSAIQINYTTTIKSAEFAKTEEIDLLVRALQLNLPDYFPGVVINVKRDDALAQSTLDVSDGIDQERLWSIITSERECYLQTFAVGDEPSGE